MPDRSTGSNQNACTPETVRRLSEQGHGRNEIARKLNVNVYQVHKAAREAGVTFDRSATKAATAARVADAQAERIELAEQFRQVGRTILTKVLDSNPGDLDPAALRDLLWSAGSAAASDARYGKLLLDYQTTHIAEDEQIEAAEKFATLLQGLREGFQTLEDTPIEEFEDDDDAAEPP